MKKTRYHEAGHYRLGAGNLADTTACEVIERFKVATGTTNVKDLANWLDTKECDIADAKRKNIIPYIWLQKLTEKKSEYAPAWVLSGKSGTLWSCFPCDADILQ